ncbi:MAG TPA: hypothetical protein VMU71_07440 [Terracidiphilus sp.]|nr:hypothetical protein [Terracidiphilus sp.]
MNTAFAVGPIRIHFESRARRRRFVALCYAVFAMTDLVWCFLNPKMNPAATPTEAAGAWIVAGCMFLCVLLWMVLSGLSGDIRARGDERENHRRRDSISRAYPALGFAVMACTFSASFAIPTANVTPALREFLMQLTFILLMVSFFLYATLPQAILLWTEPDMEAAESR